jgi:hemerythrin-like domain-containing protein
MGDAMTILDKLRHEHASAVQLLRALEWQLSEFKLSKQPDYDVLLAAVDYFTTFPGLSHHPSEDLIFDKLRERAPDIADSVGDLRGAHDALADRVRALAHGLGSILAEAELPREAILRWFAEFIDHQRQHIEMEESTFFPAAEKRLTEGDWRAIQAEIARSVDPVLEANADEKFAELREAIVTWQRQDEASLHLQR